MEKGANGANALWEILRIFKKFATKTQQNEGNTFYLHIIPNIVRPFFVTLCQHCSQNHKKEDISIDFHIIR